MTVDERLNRVRDGWAEFSRLNDRLEELEAVATKVTPLLTDMPKGSAKPKDDTWALLIDTRIACERQVRQYLDDCEALDLELNFIRNPKIRTAMKFRYINCCKTEDIAEKMSYDERSIKRLLAKGRELYYAEYRNETEER